MKRHFNIETFGSGSTGNCYRISNGDTTLLVECGLRFKEIQQKSKFTLSSVDACLLTHEHKDHSFAVKDILKSGIPIYLTKGTREALHLSSPHFMEFGEVKNNIYPDVHIGSFIVRPIKTIHDAKEPVGFMIWCKLTGQSLLFVTDTADFPYRFNNINYLMMECNYIKRSIDQSVMSDRVNIKLRKRIINSHMSLERFIRFLSRNNIDPIKQIYVLHLSDQNSDADEIKRTIQSYTGKEVIIC
ncbi:MAG: MBL fold metallo-hydrolase [Vagococcus sp.]|nr:MBL fold metallo-hydrolase [Vagococcus sp.]